MFVSYLTSLKQIDMLTETVVLNADSDVEVDTLGTLIPSSEPCK